MKEERGNVSSENIYKKTAQHRLQHGVENALMNMLSLCVVFVVCSVLYDFFMTNKLADDMIDATPEFYKVLRYVLMFLASFFVVPNFYLWVLLHQLDCDLLRLLIEQYR